MGAATTAGNRDRLSTSMTPRADDATDMSFNSNSGLLGGGGADDGGTMAHSTGAFSSLGYTNVLEGGVHPAWGVAANQTEALQPAAAAAAALPEGSPAVPGGGPQVNKWGFVPGDEDTTDLDLERNGALVIGLSSCFFWEKHPCLHALADMCGAHGIDESA